MPEITKLIMAIIPMMLRRKLATFSKIPLTSLVLVGNPVLVGIVSVVGVLPLVLLAEQEAEAPQVPVQLQVHGPLPVIVAAVPSLQRFAVGAEENDWPLELPQLQAFTSTAFRASHVTESHVLAVQLHCQ